MRVDPPPDADEDPDVVMINLFKEQLSTVRQRLESHDPDDEDTIASLEKEEHKLLQKIKANENRNDVCPRPNSFIPVSKSSRNKRLGRNEAKNNVKKRKVLESKMKAAKNMPVLSSAYLKNWKEQVVNSDVHSLDTWLATVPDDDAELKRNVKGSILRSAKNSVPNEEKFKCFDFALVTFYILETVPQASRGKKLDKLKACFTPITSFLAWVLRKAWLTSVYKPGEVVRPMGPGKVAKYVEVMHNWGYRRNTQFTFVWKLHWFLRNWILAFRFIQDERDVLAEDLLSALQSISDMVEVDDDFLDKIDRFLIGVKTLANDLKNVKRSERKCLRTISQWKIEGRWRTQDEIDKLFYDEPMEYVNFWTEWAVEHDLAQMSDKQYYSLACAVLTLIVLHTYYNRPEVYAALKVGHIRWEGISRVNRIPTTALIDLREIPIEKADSRHRVGRIWVSADRASNEVIRQDFMEITDEDICASLFELVNHPRRKALRPVVRVRSSKRQKQKLKDHLQNECVFSVFNNGNLHIPNGSTISGMIKFQQRFQKVLGRHAETQYRPHVSPFDLRHIGPTLMYQEFKRQLRSQDGEWWDNFGYGAGFERKTAKSSIESWLTWMSIRMNTSEEQLQNTYLLSEVGTPAPNAAAHHDEDSEITDSEPDSSDEDDNYELEDDELLVLFGGGAPGA